jgi:hypothetical protein
MELGLHFRILLSLHAEHVGKAAVQLVETVSISSGRPATYF